MHRAARLMAGTILSAAMLGTIVTAQINIRPTPAPAITAENEGWYQRGEPIVFAGNLYYRAGAAIHFNPDEMVRSGAFEGVPLYTRTTIEPYSVVFVPIEDPDRIDVSSVERRLRRRVDLALREIIVEDTWGLAPRALEVSGAPGERAEQVLARVGAQPDA